MSTKRTPRRRRKADPKPTYILEDYATYEQLADETGKSVRWFQRQAAQRLLAGLVYNGKTPLVHLPTYKAGLQARVIKPIQPRTRQRTKNWRAR